MKFDFSHVLGAASATLAVLILQMPAIAQNGDGYFSGLVPNDPQDQKTALLFERVDALYNAGGIGPQEAAELRRNLMAIESYEIWKRLQWPSSKPKTDRINAMLDEFSAGLDAHIADKSGLR